MDLKRWSKTYKKFKLYNLEKGHQYYVDKKVLDYSEKEEGLFVGTSLGSNNEIYYLELNLKHFHKSKCSCPYGEKGHKCKHLAALYFSLYGDEWFQDYKDSFYVPYDPELGEKLDDFIEDKVEQIVNKLSKKELKERLIGYLLSDSRLIDELECEFYKEYFEE